MPDVRSGLDPKDYRFINPNPDPDFSPERNMAVVKEVQEETDVFLRDLHKVMAESSKDRLDILSHYARYTIGEGKTKNLRDYLGKQQYEALVGEKVLSKVRVAETMNRLNGNTRFKKGILL